MSLESFTWDRLTIIVRLTESDPVAPCLVSVLPANANVRH